MSKSVEIILQGLREPLEMIQFSFMRNPPVSVKDSQSESKGEQRFGALRAFTFKEKKVGEFLVLRFIESTLTTLT